MLINRPDIEHILEITAGGYVYCMCQQTLKSVEEIVYHHQLGHFDLMGPDDIRDAEINSLREALAGLLEGLDANGPDGEYEGLSEKEWAHRVQEARSILEACDNLGEGTTVDVDPTVPDTHTYPLREDGRPGVGTTGELP